MERKYWLGRKHAAMGMARGATSAQARLIHYELAGLYSIKAARSPIPFMLPIKGPATIGERAALTPNIAPRAFHPPAERRTGRSGAVRDMKFGRGRKPHVTPLADDARARQGRIVNLALASLASADAAKAFLNTHHEGLRGRPLDLATGSSEGLIAVEAAIGEERLHAAMRDGPLFQGEGRCSDLAVARTL